MEKYHMHPEWGLSMKTGEIVECSLRCSETCLRKVFRNLIPQFLPKILYHVFKIKNENCRFEFAHFISGHGRCPIQNRLINRRQGLCS